MCTPYYCNECGKGFKNATQHNCKMWCNICGRVCIKGEEKFCFSCNRTCSSLLCCKNHKISKKINRGSHKGQITTSLYEQFWLCHQCGITLQRSQRDPKKHECGEVECLVCNEYYLYDNHKCYIRAQYSEKDINKFIFYDFECHQKNDIHVPNYVVAMSICHVCENEPISDSAKCNNCGTRCFLCNKYNEKENEYEHYPCIGCGKRQVTFKGVETQNKFCEWLFAEDHKNFTAIAHNSKVYDSYFIYNYMLQNSIIPDPIIFSGSKIMYMRIGRQLNMRIIDSLNFLPMPLSHFPKCFQLKKGYFSHYFNIPENENVTMNNLPNIKFYDPDSMSNERREEFMKWYDLHKNDYFDFAKEIHDYYVSDVKILMEGCMKFRNLVKCITGEQILELNPDEMIFEETYQNSLDPLSFLTIAPVCLGIFRSKFLPEKWKVLTEKEHLKNSDCFHEWNCKCQWLEARKKNATSPLEVLINGEWMDVCNIKVFKSVFVKLPIALIPPHGYNKSDNHSKQSLEWLYTVQKHYQEIGHDITTQHACSEQGEKVVLYYTSKNVIRYKLDGYFEINNTKYTCEFYGCNWHGCPKCYIRDREVTVNNGKSLALRYKETLLKQKRLKELGYVLLSKWSCEFKIDLIQDPVLNDYVNNLNIIDSIDTRDSYFEGRTNALNSI